MRGVLAALRSYTDVTLLTSLGNRSPWEVAFYPTQLLDIAYAVVLMLTFSIMKHATLRVAREVRDHAPARAAASW